MKRTLTLLIFVFLMPIGTNVSAEDLSAEVSSLRQQVQALRDGSLQSNSGAAQAIATIQDLQTRLEALKGSIETNTHLIQSQAQNTDLKLSDMEARIASVEERLAIQGKQVTSAISTVAPEAAKEAELYQFALNQINNGEYLKAMATLKKFSKSFPKSDYTPNVQYWLADCYFAMRDYEKAIKEFQILTDKYPRSDKAPAALLKQVYSFSELNMENEANLFLNTLLSKYPHSKEAREATNWKERNKALKASEKKPTVGGDVPLAPGVEVPENQNKNAQEKYR